MPILITIVACAVMIVLQMSSSSFFVSQTQNYQRERVMAEKTEAVRLVGPLLRDGFELYTRYNGNCALIGMTLKNTSAGPICWQSGDPCVASKALNQNPMYVCPWRGTTATFALGRLFLNSAHAVEINIVPRTPGATTGGVRLLAPACSATGPCVNCAHPNTSCFTLYLCVGRTPNPNCADGDRIRQTFAFRR